MIKPVIAQGRRPRLRVLVGCGGLGLAVMLFTLTGVARGASWSIQPASSPTIVEPSALLGVSCVPAQGSSARTCVAVGQTGSTGSPYETLAMGSNGGKWALQAIAVPAGATDIVLEGVSCSSATACTAVGGYEDQSGTQTTLAERWNGTKWSIQATPNPSPVSIFSSVSCFSATVCTAVGETGDQLLAERWSGGSWTAESIPTPSGGGNLAGVSCGSVNACTAVGYYNGGAKPYLPLVEQWDGTSWVTETAPARSSVDYSLLNAVSCTSPNACTAVGGDWTASSTHMSLAERWNGTRWSLQATPNTSQGAELFGVSCPSTDACTAAGEGSTMLAQRWNGTSWSMQALPSPAAGNGSEHVSAVACTSASDCTAVGNYSTASKPELTLVEVTDGSQWVQKSSPDPTGPAASELSGVSCQSASVCTAVGGYYNQETDLVTLAEGWNGSDWAVEPSPTPAGSANDPLNQVSCTSTSSCIATGSPPEQWNGVKWTTLPTPALPAQASDGTLPAISCAAARACTAVGTFLWSTITANDGWAAQWNGTSWSTETAYPDSARNSGLSAVSCPAANLCTAVGREQNASYQNVTMAERWNGTSWTLQPTPNPSGFPALLAVSCPSSTACMAVGQSQASDGAEVMLSERWNGTSWTIKSTPAPAGATSTTLSAVSCSSPNQCTAVGSYINSAGAQVPLAEGFNGTSWLIQPTPRPADSTGVSLSAVSCWAEDCTAVGSYTDSTDTVRQLIERY